VPSRSRKKSLLLVDLCLAVSIYLPLFRSREKQGPDLLSDQIFLEFLKVSVTRLLTKATAAFPSQKF
jgi:hypothetical protein